MFRSLCGFVLFVSLIPAVSLAEPIPKRFAEPFVLRPGSTGLLLQEVNSAGPMASIELLIWDVEQRKETFRLPLGQQALPPWGAAFSGDGRLLALVRRPAPDKGSWPSLEVYDVVTKQLVKKIEWSSMNFWGALSMSSTGDWLAKAVRYGVPDEIGPTESTPEVQYQAIFDVKMGKVAALHPSKQTLFNAFLDKDRVLASIDTAELEPTAAERQATGLARKHIVDVRLYSVERGSHVGHIHFGWFRPLLVMAQPEPPVAFVYGEDQRKKVRMAEAWDLQTGLRIASYKFEPDILHSLKINSKKEIVCITRVIGSSPGQLSVYDLRSGKLIRQVSLPEQVSDPVEDSTGPNSSWIISSDCLKVIRVVRKANPDGTPDVKSFSVENLLKK